MSSLCAYSNIFGVPGKGIHSIRIFNIAVVDLLLAVVGAYILYYLKPTISFWIWLLIVLIAGIILHRLFCVRTTVDKLLFN